MSKFPKAGLVAMALAIAWPIMDGCWYGFLGSPDWRNDAIFHSIIIAVAACLFLLPFLIQRLKPNSA
jgi:hypothetical protein